jgi:nudix-type nucleoside diphosphatase (YffH/AdpP family)
MKAEKLKSTKLLGKPLRVEEVKYRYQQFDGEMSGKVSKVIVKRNDAVSAVVYNTDTQQYLFAKQFRYASFSKGEGWLTELMAGVIDKGETLEDALHREMEEELGFAPVKIEKLMTFYTAPGYSIEQVHLYYVEVNNDSRKSTGGGMADEHENIDVIFYSLEDIGNIMEANGFTDAKTIIGCNYILNNVKPDTSSQNQVAEPIERPWPMAGTL